MKKNFVAKFLCMMLALIMVMSAVGTLPVFAAMSTIDLVFTNPGEDSSTQMRVAWHSSSSSCVLYYTKASDTSFSSAKTVSATRTSTPTTFSDNSSFYKYEAEITGLTPGTEYIYKIVAGSTTSSVHTFKTAEKDNAFNFMWMGDVHANSSESAKMTNVTKLLGYAESNTASKGGIDFVLFSGDAVKYGQRYSDWQQWNNNTSTKDYMFAMVCGNKEYYSTSGSRTSNKWYSAIQNNPNNGVSGLDSTYWFIYNNVLFIGLDNLVGEGSEMSSSVQGTDLQKAWFEDVVTSQKGNYQYIVVFQHYPYFKSSGVCSYGGYDKWKTLFDEYGVDFAISGDSHSYVRTNQLKGDSESSSGTVYMVGPQIGTSLSAPNMKTGSGQIAKYDSNGTSYGACYFVVTSSSITLNYIANSTTVVDTVTVKAKRPAVSSGNSGSTATPTPAPTTAPSTSGYAIYEQFDNGYKAGSAAKDTTNGAWSTAYSSSMAANHVTFVNTSSSGYQGTKGLKAVVADGRYTIDLYLGFQGASATDTLKFKTYIPTGSTISSIKKIAVNGVDITGSIIVAQGQWVQVESSALGATSGYITIEYYSSGGASGDYFYIDDVFVGSGNAATPTPKPTATPTPKPTATPTPKPTATPTPKPTATPTAKPTATPAGNTINSYVMEMKSSTDNSRCRVKLTDAVKTGDIISFYVKLVGYNGGSVEGADMYARGNGTKAVYVDSNGNETTTAVYSGSRIANNAVDCGNGWYYITCMVKADCSSGFELSVDAGNIASGTIGQCVIAGVKINGKEVSVVGYNSGSAITPAAISAPNGSGNTTPTVVKINSYAMEMKSSTDNSRCRVKLTDAVKTGDIISFYVKLVGYNGGSVEGADMYARGNGTKAVYVDSNGNETTTAVYSGSRIANNAVDCGNGWYYITCMVKADCSSGFELSVDAGNIASGAIGQCLIADVRINGSEVSVVGYNSGTAISPVQVTKP